MLSALGTLLYGQPQEEWEIWEEWQKNQSEDHFLKSEIFEYFKSCQPNFDYPNPNPDDKYLSYCFGDFTVFLVNPKNGGNVINYLSKLLLLYDTCKGFMRCIKGDPIGIARLREVVSRKSLEPLYTINLQNYYYDYTNIHSHTVVQFSLSTLIMRLVANYLAYLTTKTFFVKISPSACKETFENVKFGSVVNGTRQFIISEAVQIYPNAEPEFKSSSWPNQSYLLGKCKVCNKSTYTFWGEFQSCLDCYNYRICSECGVPGVMIGFDNLPKCEYHSGK